MFGIIKNLWNDESGATMVEYGLMVALIAVIAVAAVSALGGSVRDTFNSASGKLSTPAAQ